jgi:hypothetical protein
VIRAWTTKQVEHAASEGTRHACVTDMVLVMDEHDGELSLQFEPLLVETGEEEERESSNALPPQRNVLSEPRPRHLQPLPLGVFPQVSLLAAALLRLDRIGSVGDLPSSPSL